MSVTNEQTIDYSAYRDASGAGLNLSEATDISPRLERAQKAFKSGELNEAYEILTAPADESETLSPACKAQTDILLGKLIRERGEFERAKVAFEKALETAQHHGLRDSEANALNHLASIFAIQGDAARALELLEGAAALFEVLGQMTMWATALTNVGDIHCELSEYEEALSALSKAYNYLKDAAPTSRTTAINLQNLGLTYTALGKLERAEAFYEEALEIASVLADPVIDIVSRINLAEVYVEMGNLEQAEISFERARVLSEKANLVRYRVNAMEGLGNVCYQKNLFARAKSAHQQATDLAREIDDMSGLLNGLLNLSRDELATRSFGEAIAHAQAALLLAEQTERTRTLYQAHQLLAQAYKAQGAFEKAVYHLEAFYAVKETVFNEENANKTRRLSLKFDVEKAQHQAEVYRLESELSRRAHEKAERLVQERTAELQEAQLEIVTRLAVAAEYRDDDTGAHTRRVGRVAAILAHVLGWDLRQTQLLYSAARLHDVGKIGIPDAILHKPGKLTDAEFETMRTHAAIGSSILADGHSPLLNLAEAIAGSHHERYDGRGYPNKLAGDDIPQAARIVSVADVLDALTHARPYKDAWPLEKVLAELERNSGSQFDPEVVAVCKEVFGTQSLLSPFDVSESWQALLADLDKLTHLREDYVKKLV